MTQPTNHATINSTAETIYAEYAECIGAEPTPFIRRQLDGLMSIYPEDYILLCIDLAGMARRPSYQYMMACIERNGGSVEAYTAKKTGWSRDRSTGAMTQYQTARKEINNIASASEAAAMEKRLRRIELFESTYNSK